MTRKRGRLILFVLLIAILVGFLIWIRPQSSPTVVGVIPAEDCQHILQMIRRSMWRKAFPNFSWETVKQSPSSLYLMARTRVSHIEKLDATVVQIRVTSPKGITYYVARSTSDAGPWRPWSLDGERKESLLPYPLGKALGEWKPSRTEISFPAGFGSVLSNEAELTLERKLRPGPEVMNAR